MLDHHLQRSIVYQLAFQDEIRFSDLKPDEIENKLFTYHLKKTLSSGLVAKTEDGLYHLTPEGRRYSTGVRDKDQMLIVERAHSVIFLVIRRKSDGAWLLYTRQTHPLLGYSGVPHANPNSEQSSVQSAHQQIKERTSLDARFKPLGGGYFRIFKDGALESFTHFTLLVCDDVQGELIPTDTKATYYWATEPDFNAPDMFPSSQSLVKAYQDGKPFFIEETFYI